MKKQKWEVVDLGDWHPRYSYNSVNTYYLQWFELMRFHEEKCVWFGVGQWSSHIMDWRGCNFWHGRLPKSPVFDNLKEAIDWLYFQVENGAYKDGMKLNGHHSGDPDCKSCNKGKSNWIFDTRETDVTVYHYHISGNAKQRKSRLKTYRDNLRNF